MVFRALLFALIASCISSAQSSLAVRARAALSQTSGTIRIGCVRKPVRVLRDRWGVAHIYARNDHDLFCAQGFVAAQDRLFQMELWKRVGQGRLAEVVGERALERDVNARLLRYRGDMAIEYASYGANAREILSDFTAGINAYIAERRRSGRGWPVEFQIAGFQPEEWRPEDCLSRMAGFPMTGNAVAELYHAQLVAALGARKATSLLDLDPAVQLDPAAGANYTGLASELLRHLVGSDTRVEFPQSVSSQGSNNWTISGRLTSTGRPMLANDPHRTIAEPSLRYIVHLVAPGWDVIGAGEPALPGVAAGHNQHIAWGFTVFPIDQQDLYIEQLNPANRLQYRGPHGWESMRVEREEFRIKGRAPVTRAVKFTRHGPVLWEDSTRALALRWTGGEPGTAGYLGCLALDRARNWSEFLSAMARWKLPAENLVYADTDGNIGEQSAGLAPLRRNWTGLLPVSGGGKYEWAGFVPLNQLPRVFNPPAGFYATANNKVIPPNYPYNIGFEWTAPYRIERINQVLERDSRTNHKLTVDDIAQLQNDVTSLAAQQFISLLRTKARGSGDPEVQRLANWNGELRRDSETAALYELWRSHLHSLLLERFLTTTEQTLAGSHLGMPKLVEFARRADRQLYMSALVQAQRELRSRTWGDLHTVTFRHPLDSVPGGSELVDRGPLPRPGDSTTVNATGGAGYTQTSGASYREILDLSNWDHSLAVNTPGQSGEPASPHYADLLPLWENGEYFPLLYSWRAVEKAATDRLTLEPLR